MLLPQSPKKSRQVVPAPPLETPEECRRAEERDEALTKRAKRREAEAVADRASFELTRDKVLFAVELTVSLLVLLAASIILALNPVLAPVTFLSGGMGGIALFRQRKPAQE
jgi:hypothetical protein